MTGIVPLARLPPSLTTACIVRVLLMEATRFSEISIIFYQITRRYTSEDNNYLWQSFV